MATGNEKLRGAISGSAVSGKVSPTIYYTDAYNIAVAHGFEGSVEEWLESLKGEPGQVDTEQIEKSVVAYLSLNPPQVAEKDPTVPEWAKADTKPAYTAEEVGAVGIDQLDTAIEAALAQAKESGAFDGNSGYTPVRGTDYWTDSDKAEIKSYVDNAILGGAW